MRFKNVKVGDYLYCSGEHRSDSRMDRERYKGLWKVLKVGRIYITLCQEGYEDSAWMHQKTTKDGRSDYGFYLSEEEFAERDERIKLVTLIQKEYERAWRNPKYDIPLEDLRTAVKLLKVKE
jgi:hypothetical protein